MTDKCVLFGEFDIPVLSGLEYLVNEDTPNTDFLFVNDSADSFSMYFEKDFPIFTVPEKTDRDYGLFELKRQDRIIKFFCPEKRENLGSAVWYFYLEMLGSDGKTYVLPGQVRVSFDVPAIIQPTGKPKFFDVLERVGIHSDNDNL